MVSIQSAQGWSMGVQREREFSLGLDEIVWVSGQERPDWRVSGAITLMSGQAVIRLVHGVWGEVKSPHWRWSLSIPCRPYEVRAV
jgi:hypothetical protein